MDADRHICDLSAVPPWHLFLVSGLTMKDTYEFWAVVLTISAMVLFFFWGI